MLYGIYEFEVIEDNDCLLAIPYDLEGGTQGEGWGDLCLMVADWLKAVLEDSDIHGKHLPKPTFGNTPRHGGQNMVFGASAGRETIEKVSATHAARMLGVSPGRVTQMLAANLLEGWREGRNTYITVDSVNARLEGTPHAGRPRKKAVA